VFDLTHSCVRRDSSICFERFYMRGAATLPSLVCSFSHSFVWSVLQCVSVCCSVLQCVAVCCSVLQCLFLHPLRAVLCSVNAVFLSFSFVSSVVRCVAVCCSVVQCVALSLSLSFVYLPVQHDPQLSTHAHCPRFINPVQHYPQISPHMHTLMSIFGTSNANTYVCICLHLMYQIQTSSRVCTCTYVRVMLRRIHRT